MSDPIASPPVGAASEPTKRRGCFFYGCVTVLVLMALCLFVAYVIASGDAATMTAAFIRRVRAMGQPE